MTSTSFADRLREARQARDLTQEELARVTGLTSITISRYERGKLRPKFDHLRRIANALRTTAEALMPDPSIGCHPDADMDAT